MNNIEIASAYKVTVVIFDNVDVFSVQTMVRIPIAQLLATSLFIYVGLGIFRVLDIQIPCLFEKTCMFTTKFGIIYNV